MSATVSHAAALSPAAAAKAAALKLLKKIRRQNNFNSVKFFAAGMAGIIVLFIISKCIRFIYLRYFSRNRSPLLKGPVAITRLSRSILLRRIWGFTSVGHFVVFIIYVATLLSVSFCNVNEWDSWKNIAKRLGWVATAHIALLTFLAMKNNPLAFLTEYSYESLRLFHKIAGYVCVIWATLHAICYIMVEKEAHTWHVLREESNVVGIVAGIAMLIMAFTSIFIYRMQYEIWYIIHIMMYLLILITVGMHKPVLSDRVVYIIFFTSCLWFSDRLLRYMKVAYFWFGNYVTLTPLPNGGVRILMRKSHKLIKAGTHAFLWIPGIRAIETHPFTVATADEVDGVGFMVVACDGFTKDLYELAVKNPGIQLRASIDGPYGSVVDFTQYDKVIFISGGSGGSFTFGVAINTMRKLIERNAVSKTIIEFIWVIREEDSISWFGPELQELCSFPDVILRLYCTRNAADKTFNGVPSLSESLSEKLPSSVDEENEDKSRDIGDPEKVATHNAIRSIGERQLVMHSGRPDIPTLIHRGVESCDISQRVAIAACGPSSLMHDTRLAVAKSIKVNGPSVELFSEEFSCEINEKIAKIPEATNQALRDSLDSIKQSIPAINLEAEESGKLRSGFDEIRETFEKYTTKMESLEYETWLEKPFGELKKSFDQRTDEVNHSNIYEAYGRGIQTIKDQLLELFNQHTDDMGTKPTKSIADYTKDASEKREKLAQKFEQNLIPMSNPLPISINLKSMIIPHR
ncbi:hypothetical protein NHQ30_008952 [Ciborinia camelliae]|nr:hypothetical protein NHQ30_008952 [Ciborinia camelliae]